MSETKSAAELEREVEAQRAEIDHTVDSLRDRLSPDAAIDYGIDYMRRDGGRRLMRAVRENPLAAVLAATGIGWLAYTASRPGRGVPARDHHYDPDRSTHLTYPDGRRAADRPLPGASAAAPGTPAPPLDTMTEREARERHGGSSTGIGTTTAGTSTAGTSTGGTSTGGTPRPRTSTTGVMGDGTEEQNLGQRGTPGARITKDEVEDAFGTDKPKPSSTTS